MLRVLKNRYIDHSPYHTSLIDLYLCLPIAVPTISTILPMFQGHHLTGVTCFSAGVAVDFVEWLKNGQLIHDSDSGYSKYQNITDYVALKYENKLSTRALKFGDKVTCKVFDSYGRSDSKDLRIKCELCFL